VVDWVGVCVFLSFVLYRGYGPLHTHTREWEPVTISLQALSLVGKAEPVQVRFFTLRLRDQRSMWMRDRWKVYVDSYVALDGSCFMVTWTIFKNHLLGVGLPQSRRPWHSECSQPLVCSILSCVRTCVNRFSLKWHLVEGPVTYDFTLHSRARDQHYMIVEVCLGRPSDTFFWDLTISWSRLLARVWSGPMYIMRNAGTFTSQETLGGMLYFESFGRQTTLNIVFIVIW
jgi:hypothetical protein